MKSSLWREFSPEAFLPLVNLEAKLDSESTDSNHSQIPPNYKDPVTDDNVGKFSNPKFTELYNTLVERGKKSLVEAFKVGAFIEDLDIKDLQDAIARTNRSDIKIVYENLTKASKNHIRSFIKQLQRYGQTYTPKFIGSPKEL